MTPHQRTDPQRLAVLAKRIMAHVEDPSDAGRAALARHFLAESVLLGIDASLLRAVMDANAAAAAGDDCARSKVLPMGGAVAYLGGPQQV